MDDVKFISAIRVADAGERSFTHSYVDDSEQCLVEQSHKDSCDINFIMKKYEQTGQLHHVMEAMPNFGDFDPITYQEAKNATIAAEDAFMSLPAKLRQRFDNDPGKFLEFTDDPANAEELINLGLATAKPVPDATLKDVVEAVKSAKTTSKKKTDPAEG